MPRNSKNQGNSVNQLDFDEIKSQTINLRIKRQYGEGQMSGKRAKTRSGKGNKNQSSSPVESPISVVGESPCGQVDSLLVSRLLRPRQKSA
jgi:hypothetical protein